MWVEDNVCPGKPEQGSDTLEVELKVELSLLMQVLGTKFFFFFWRAASAFSRCTLSSSLVICKCWDLGLGVCVAIILGWEIGFNQMFMTI